MQSLPGFRDFLPEECAKRNYIFARWREVARRYGFVEWEGPPLEPTELYKKKSGDEIVEQLFNFTDKGEREVALRPELTPTLARVVALHEREFKKPLKWFSIGQFFRYEKQQRGRLREHFQLNCDIIGESDLTADIELVSLCIDVLRAFGFTEKDFAVRISDREFWTDFLREKDVPADRWGEFLQAIDKFGREARGAGRWPTRSRPCGLRRNRCRNRPRARLLHGDRLRGVRSRRKIPRHRRWRAVRQFDRTTQ